MEPPVAGPERDVCVRAECAVVVVAEGVERRLRCAGAPRGEDDGRRTLQRDVRRRCKLLALSEQVLRLWPQEVSASRLQECFVIGDQGRAGRLLEQWCDPSWRYAVAQGAGYVSGPDQGEHQRHITLVSLQIQRHPAPCFEFPETKRRCRDQSVQLLVRGAAARADEGSGFGSGERRRAQRTGNG